MSGMMEGNIKYTEDYRNDILSGWLNVDTSSMPPIYTMSNQVYLIRLKDNTYQPFVLPTIPMPEA